MGHSKTRRERIDSAGDHQDFAAIFGLWPFLHEIGQRQVRAGVCRSSPSGNRSDFLAKAWSVVRFWATKTVPLRMYPTPIAVVAGCASMKSSMLRYCKARVDLEVSSIRIKSWSPA